MFVFFTISCSNENEVFAPNNESLSQMQFLYEDSKELTLIHNEMLDDFYKQTLSNGLKFSKPLSDEEMSQFVTQFVSMIEQPTATRSVTWNDAIDVNQVIKINQMNDAISNLGALHAGSENLEDIAYLGKFKYSYILLDYLPRNLYPKPSIKLLGSLNPLNWYPTCRNRLRVIEVLSAKT